MHSRSLLSPRTNLYSSSGNMNIIRSSPQEQGTDTRQAKYVISLVSSRARLHLKWDDLVEAWKKRPANHNERKVRHTFHGFRLDIFATIQPRLLFQIANHHCRSFGVGATQRELSGTVGSTSRHIRHSVGLESGCRNEPESGACHLRCDGQRNSPLKDH